VIYERLFPRWTPRDELRPRSRSGAGASLLVRWLGTAAHLVESATTRVAIDPFVTRPSLARVAGARLEPDDRELDARLGVRIDAVLCGHSHYDHLMDAPRVARAHGAKLVGSRTTCAFGRAAGLDESQLVEVPPAGRTVTIGDLTVRFVPSRHGRIFLGRVPFPGEALDVGHLPVRAPAYRMGGAFGIHLTSADGARVYHNGSADLVDAELAPLRADVVLVGLAGRQATRDYVARLTGLLAPRVIVPTHHDAFFAPLDRGVHLLPGIDLDGFVSEARSLAKNARVITPDYGEAIAVPAASPGDAAILD
jgi:L-ascorbate metabolism protein UlaG (beta-lactamase superfamily)